MLLNWNVKSGGPALEYGDNIENLLNLKLHVFKSVAWTSTYIFEMAEWRELLLIKSISDYIIVEKLTPPLNVSVNCTEASHRCSIWWQPPRTSTKKKSSCFKYEIVIESKVRIIMTFNSTFFLFPHITPYNQLYPPFESLDEHGK